MNAQPLLSFLALALSLVVRAADPADQPPTIPVGLDAYRMWDKWPQQRIGARAYMRSTYDRRGANETADASHFLYQLADDNNVTLEVQGHPGILYFARYNHWHGSPWRYVVDGKEHIVQETSSNDPTKPVPGSVFEPRELFPPGLTWTWSTTKGADLMWVPIGFEKSFRMGYSRTCYGTGYYIYHHYVPGTKLSQPIKAWDGTTPPDQDVVNLIARAGEDLYSTGRDSGSGTQTLGAKSTLQLSPGVPGPRTIRAIKLSIPAAAAEAAARIRLRITWDHRPHPSVDAPLPLFFGTGTLYNRDNREWLVKAFPVNVRYAERRIHLACYFPMPYFEHAKIELVNESDDELRDIQWLIRADTLQAPRNHLSYFHATYKDHTPNPPRGGDLVLLDTRHTEGGGDWTGSFVGTSFIFTKTNTLTTLEGDPRFYFDDSMSPQAYGTGTEEWGGGGDYWGGRNMTLPFAGHPVGARELKEAKNDLDQIHSAYRFLLADLFPFGKNARITLEHGGENDSTEHYETVTYWYGLPGASVVKTDELKIGDPASERAHNYNSPNASEPYEITSRYEWGVDTLRSGGFERPQANPRHYADFEFEAKPNARYHIWIRGKNLDGNNLSDASWLQFDDAIGTRNLGPTYAHDKAFGNWLDRFPANTFAWSSALPQEPPQTITFFQGGKHRLRIQPRHPGHVIDQIWLSTTRSELPDKDAKPATTPDLSEVVLNAASATSLRGDVRVINDPASTTRKAFSIGGARELQVYPPHTDTGRKTTGTSEFTLKLDPNNFGAMLRRKLDYQFPNQRAEISVADASDPARQLKDEDFKSAGVWYLAGSNTCVFSRPPGELDPPLHIVQTSNRRFRDDEFLIGRDLTQGRAAIRVRVKFTPTSIPLFPGHPLAETAWSEIKYTAYSFVMPRAGG